MIRKALSVAVLLVAVAALVLWLRDREDHCEPAPPNDFTDFTLTLFDGREPLPEVLEVQPRTGVFVDIRLHPKEPRPETITSTKTRQEWALQPPEKWPMTIAYYPEGYRQEKPPGRYWGSVECYSAKSTRHRREAPRGMPHSPGFRGGWQECGFEDPPPVPADLKPGELRSWTFLAPPVDKTSGEYVYELWAQPAAYTPKGWTVTKYGPGVILWRGKLRVVQSATPQ